MTNPNLFDPESPEFKQCQSLALGVHTLAPSPTNPRTHFDVAELTESVRENGVMTPLLVRLWPVDYQWRGEMPLYEIVAGERRWRAATAAGLKLIPGILRDLTTEQVVKLQLIENLQREDLHELDEAEGYERMIRDYGYTAESIAEAIHKSRSYVFARLKLLDLDADSRRLFRGGSLPASTALLLARVPTLSLRTKALKELMEKDHNGDLPSVRRAQKILRDRYMLDLKNASFPINDKDLPGGPCKSCPKRTGNLPADLFEDVKNANVCTDPDCHQAKALAYKQRVAAEAEAKGLVVVTGEAAKKVTGGYLSDYGDNVGTKHTKLDAVCQADPEKRTYAQILGDEAQPTLVEHPQRQELVPVIANTVLADKLKAAGIITPEAKREQTDKKTAEKLAAERAYRERLADDLADKVAACRMGGAPAELDTDQLTALLREIVEGLWGRAQGSDGIDRVIKYHGATGKNITARKEDFARIVAEAGPSSCWQLIVSLLVVGETVPTDWSISQGYKPERMERLAAAFGINAPALRKALDAERKAEAKAENTAKPGKKAASPAGKKAPPPTKAAQAREETGAEKPAFAVGDRVRVKTDITDPNAGDAWKAQVCGKLGEVFEIYDGDVYVVRLDETGKKDEFSADELEPAPEAAQAEGIGSEIETNETPTATDTASGIPSAGLIEMKEKPTATPTASAPYIHPDDATLTWSGRGRRPKWIEAWQLKTGGRVEDLRRGA